MRRRRRRPSWLVLAIALSACMRGNGGCNLGGGTRPGPVLCVEASDCESWATCQRGKCVNADYVRVDDACRASAACAERGDCSAIRRRSFLGLDPSFECAAITDDECRRSARCRTHGLCARNPLYDAGCAAPDASACRASARCATREECELDGERCARRWTGCPALALPGAPAWAAPVRLAWSYDDLLRAPWQPGEVAHATLACWLTGTRGGGLTTVRVAGRCATGSALDRSGAGSFLRADVALHAGDAIAFSAEGGAFAQLHYDGSSPAFGGSGDEAIECVVVPPAVALERSRRELAAVDRDLVAAPHEPVDLSSRSAFLDEAIDDAHVHAERAALWLGWTSPELLSRVARLDAEAGEAHARVDAAIRKLVATDKPVRGEHMTVTRLGRVCGAAKTCALELAIDNAGPSPISIEPGRDGFDRLDALTWLRPAHGAEPSVLAPALIAEVRVGAASTTRDAVEIPPGTRGIVRIDGALPGSLLHGQIDGRSSFVLRGD